MAANQARAVQTRFGQLAAIEHAVWRLMREPDWRTDSDDEIYEFDGLDYIRKVFGSNRTCPPGVIMVSVTAPGASSPVTAGLRIQYEYQDTVYITDTENNKIKKVDPDGYVFTVPTPELDKPHGVAVDASGNIYIADTHNDRIIRVDTADNSQILANGLVDNPHGLFVHDGSKTRLYIADQKNNRVKTWEIVGFWAVVRTVSAGGLQKPRGVALDCQGNLYIADTDNHRIKRVDTGGEVSTFFSDGLDDPWDVAVDDRGNVYIADEENHRVLKVNTAGQATEIGGSMLKPHGVAVGASGNVYFTDTDNHCVRKVDTDGVVSVIAGKCGTSGDNNSRNNSKLDKPRTVAVLSQVTATAAGLEWVAESY